MLQLNSCCERSMLQRRSHYIIKLPINCKAAVNINNHEGWGEWSNLSRDYGFNVRVMKYLLMRTRATWFLQSVLLTSSFGRSQKLYKLRISIKTDTQKNTCHRYMFIDIGAQIYKLPYILRYTSIVHISATVLVTSACNGASKRFRYSEVVLILLF